MGKLTPGNRKRKRTMPEANAGKSSAPLSKTQPHASASPAYVVGREREIPLQARTVHTPVMANAMPLPQAVKLANPIPTAASASPTIPLNAPTAMPSKASPRARFIGLVSLLESAGTGLFIAYSNSLSR